MPNAYKTGTYTSVLAQHGIPQTEIDAKIEAVYAHLFSGEHSIYFETEEDGVPLGYLVDTGNDDVRTEGQSYGMMIAVQLDRKDVFDRIWAWTMKYMYLPDGDYAGYFGWSNKLDGTRNSTGPAPDGEEYFAMALLFAGRKWGDGDGIFDYTLRAREILRHMVHKVKDPMFDPDTKLIRFVPNVTFTDPSYHLPHFYELFAEYGNPEDADFFRDAARLSREYLRKACNPDTGLSPNLSDYDGVPLEHRGQRSYFFADAYRTALNIALDWEWFGADEWQRKQAAAIQRFFRDEKRFGYVHTVEGEPILDESKRQDPPDALPNGALHPLGLMATTCASCLASNGGDVEHYAKFFWALEPRTGRRRYYDNLLYMFSLLALGGRYRII